MSAVIGITNKNAPQYFSIERIANESDLSSFDCGSEEYNLYLKRDALQSQKEYLSLTWLLRDRKDRKYVAYMSVIADAIKLSVEEKTLHKINYPYRTLPAVKIAKLAVSKQAKEKYSGIGSYMINMACHIAHLTNADRFACRFITVDADIENDAGVTEFYKKNGFFLNSEMVKKNSKTINMRKDLFD